MTQSKYYSFGADSVTFIDEDHNVYAVNDPGMISINLTYEKTDHRGGTNNDIRATAIHSRNGEVTLNTGYVDNKLAQLLTGGTITSLGTSAASIITGSASGVNTLHGATTTIITGISTVTINSPTLVKTTDYYIKATNFAEVTVTRIEDGKQFSAVTLTASNTGFNLDSDRGIQFSTTEGGVSLTANEMAIVNVRSAINTINSKITFDDNKPGKLTMVATADYNGIRRTFNIPVVQPSGSIQGNNASEFHVQDITMNLEKSEALDEIADILLQG